MAFFLCRASSLSGEITPDPNKRAQGVSQKMEIKDVTASLAKTGDDDMLSHAMVPLCHSELLRAIMGSRPNALLASILWTRMACIRRIGCSHSFCLAE